MQEILLKLAGAGCLIGIPCLLLGAPLHEDSVRVTFSKILLSISFLMLCLSGGALIGAAIIKIWG